MKKYLLLFRGDYPDTAPSQEEMDAVMNEWGKWYEQLKSANALVDPGNPVNRGGKILTKESVQDGMVESNSNEWVGGYVVIQAPDIDGAVRLAQQCPSIDNSSIEVREIHDMTANM